MSITTGAATPGGLSAHELVHADTHGDCRVCPYRQRELEKPHRIGHLVLHQMQVTWRGQVVPTTASEYRVLHLMARTPAWLTYRALYDVVQSPGFLCGQQGQGHLGNMRSLIKRLRKKFLALDPGFDNIENLTAHGYRWRP